MPETPETRMAHPARIMNGLVEADAETQRMIIAAKKRGDADGAKAYELLLAMIRIVQQRADDVRSVQRWSRT